MKCYVTLQITPETLQICANFGRFYLLSDFIQKISHHIVKMYISYQEICVLLQIQSLRIPNIFFSLLFRFSEMMRELTREFRV